MKRSLIVFALAASGAAFAGEPVESDRSLPTYPDLGALPATLIADAYRVNAGESDQDTVVNRPVA